MPRGGSRPGAGRPRKTPAENKPAAEAPERYDADGYKTDPKWPFGQERPKEPEDLSSLQPLEFLLSVMRDPDEDKKTRIQAATLAAPYCHAKKGEMSVKRQEAEERKKAAGTGKFPRRKPPVALVASGGKAV